MPNKRKYTMSPAAVEQRKQAAERLKSLVKKSKEENDQDSEIEDNQSDNSGDEVVYYVDTKEKEPEQKKPKKPRKKKEPVPAETKAEEAKTEPNMEEKIKLLVERIEKLQEAEEKRSKEKESKKSKKAEREEMFIQLTKDLQARQNRKEYYNNIIDHKKNQLFNAVKW